MQISVGQGPSEPWTSLGLLRMQTGSASNHNGFAGPRPTHGFADASLETLARRAAVTEGIGAHLRGQLTPRQRTLLELVNEEPALNIREIADRMAVRRTAAKHHVQALMRQGHIVTVRQGRHVLHFPGWMRIQESKALATLRIGSTRFIVGAAYKTPGINTSQLADELGLSARTIRSTVRLMRHQGLAHLEKVPGTRARKVHLEADARTVWARWYDPAREGIRPAPLQAEPSRLALLGLFFLSWFTWSSA